MKKTLIIFVAAVFLAACNNNGSKETQRITETQVYSVTELLESANELVSETVTLKGVVVHVCKHGGQKMFITSDDKKQKIKINVSSTIPEFDETLEGSLIEVTGTVIVKAVEIHEEEEHENAETKEGENHSDEKALSETEVRKDNDTDVEESVEKSVEDDCEFEKETIVYEIKAQSYKEISE